jgi:hypothetical protein
MKSETYFSYIVAISFIGGGYPENKGHAKRGVSPLLKIRPCDLDL